MVSSLLTKGGGHECEQREPQGHEHTHVAQSVVVIQLVDQQDLMRQDHVVVRVAQEMLHTVHDDNNKDCGSKVNFTLS